MSFPVGDININAAYTVWRSEERKRFLEFLKILYILDTGLFADAFFGVEQSQPSLCLLVRMVDKQILPDLSVCFGDHQHGLWLCESGKIIEIGIRDKMMHQVTTVLPFPAGEDETDRTIL